MRGCQRRRDAHHDRLHDAARIAAGGCQPDFNRRAERDVSSAHKYAIEKMAAELAEIKQNQAAFKAEIWDEMKNMLKTKEGNVRETDKKFVVD